MKVNTTAVHYVSGSQAMFRVGRSANSVNPQEALVGPCGGLDKNGPHRFMYLNAFRVALGGEVLWEWVWP